MLNSRLPSCILLLLILTVFFYEKAEAQKNLQVSFFPGYHAINSDKLSSDPNVTQTDWIYGGSIGTRFQINNIPLEYVIGFSHGRSTILEQINAKNIGTIYTVDLRYRTLPQEIFFVHSLSDRIQLLTGVNVTAQDRTLMYSGVDIKNDRLFSMGIGLSGKVHLVLATFGPGNSKVYMNLSARWTEFIYHNEKNRILDDFTLRHVTLSPQIGVSYRFK